MKISRSALSFLVAAGIGLASGGLCWIYLRHFHLGAGDFNWSYRAAHDVLAGTDPYAHTLPRAVPYPLTAALPAFPLLLFSPETAGALFFGISSGLLAFGLVRDNPTRLLIFLAYPYWAALMTTQWTPLLMCAAFFPLAFAFTIIKPQIGTPLALTNLSWNGVAAASVLFLVSLLLLPRWPLAWIRQLGGYSYFVPLLVLPGPLLILSLWRYRERDAWLLLLAAIMPQRWFYDLFVLWLIPKSRRTILATVACSWGIGLWRWFHTPHTVQQVGLWSLLGAYLPMLAVLLVRRRDQPS